VRRGELGQISNRPLPAGWVTSTGSLSGGSTFFSLDEALVWGQSWDVKVGLLAWSYGTADSSFLSTARLSGVEFFDANGLAVTGFTLLAASGADYVGSVPELSAVWLALAGMGLLLPRSAAPTRGWRKAWRPVACIHEHSPGPPAPEPDDPRLPGLAHVAVGGRSGHRRPAAA
jgi:hypothetical protein